MVEITIAHISMQWADSRNQAEEDLAKIFSRGYAWVTGTEASNDKVKMALRVQAELNGYYLVQFYQTWVAVKKSFAKTGSLKSWKIKAIDGVARKFENRGLTGVTFYRSGIGTVSVGAGHYVVAGTPVSKNPARRVYVSLNRRFAQIISKAADRYGRGKALFFYGGDQNIVDELGDTFFGGPLTSCWDELRKWPNTGHGNIDVIASYNRDRRVSCKSARVYNDNELKLHTDHFLVEAVYTIKSL